MKKLIFYIQLFLVFAIGNDLNAQRISVSGPTEVCDNPPIAEYTISVQNHWACQWQRTVQLNGGGTILSAVDANGVTIPGSSFINFLNFSNNFAPITITVDWSGSFGCGNEVEAKLHSYSVCRGHDDILEVNVGDAGPRIEDIDLLSGSPAKSCSNILLCADIDDSPFFEPCPLDEYEWRIKGEVFSNASRCIQYYLESCPLGQVSVKSFNGCGFVQSFSKSFPCVQATPPPISYPSVVCAGDRLTGTPTQTYSVCAPAPISSIQVLDPTFPGFSYTHQGTSRCLNFTVPPLCPETIRLAITFEWCGVNVTKIISITVRCCNDGHELRIEKDVEDDVEEDLVIRPNPVSDQLSFNNKDNYKDYSIYKLSGEFISAGKLNEDFVSIEVANYASGIYLLVLKGEEDSKTLKFVKE